MPKYCFLIVFSFLFSSSFAQINMPGLVTGNVLDERQKSLEGATVELVSLPDSTGSKTGITDKEGAFTISGISFGYYKLRVSYVSLQIIIIDSIHIRQDRFDFNLGDIVLKPKKDNESLEAVVVYAEKPLIQSKDGNITFNAGESALSAGSNASDLLSNVPLVTKDPDGKVTVRGKEPKILIDDKPVELNQQQLQDLLESMPGSSIEKIEVMTNPPPQYANEQGGVINIVTKKGRVGKSGRITLHTGTRGDVGFTGNYNYRKGGFAMNLNAGGSYNRFLGEGYSIQHNIYADSSNFFKTSTNSVNKSFRTNFRANIDYDFNKFHAINFVLQYSGSDFDNNSLAQYRNINRYNQLYRVSDRSIGSMGVSYNPTINLNYTLRTKRPGEVFRFFTHANFSWNENDRLFYQQYFKPDFTPTGYDSTQQQLTDNINTGYNLRVNYDIPLNNKKTSFSAGSYYNNSHATVDVNASYKQRSDGKMLPLAALSNDFRFHQYITNMRFSAKQRFKPDFSVSAGLAAEQTRFSFDLVKMDSAAGNQYWSFLPFANINKTWKDVFNLTASYRRSIRRPGSNELNPTIDATNPHYIRFGNPELKPSLAHNFDLVAGRTKTKFYTNIGLGYTVVEDIFSQIRKRLTNDTTLITWENISERREYEISTWSGLTINRKIRISGSGSYTYNKYGTYEKEVRKFRDGGSLTANLNSTYTWKELYNATSSFTFNRFANPQGTVRSNLSMNIGLQARAMRKKATVTLNIIDPFTQQKNRTVTHFSNYTLENYNLTQSRNYRLTVSYNLTKAPSKRGKTINKQHLQKVLQSKPQS